VSDGAKVVVQYVGRIFVKVICEQEELQGCFTNPKNHLVVMLGVHASISFPEMPP
jgi:hypothetical protein